MMRLCLAAIASLSLLTGCAHKPVTQDDIGRIFAAACTIAPSAHVLFHGIVAVKPGLVDATGMEIETKAMAAIEKICAGPPPTVDTYLSVVGYLSKLTTIVIDAANGVKDK